jgi:hypothetical protein
MWCRDETERRDGVGGENRLHRLDGRDECRGRGRAKSNGDGVDVALLEFGLFAFDVLEVGEDVTVLRCPVAHDEFVVSDGEPDECHACSLATTERLRDGRDADGLD